MRSQLSVSESSCGGDRRMPPNETAPPTAAQVRAARAETEDDLYLRRYGACPGGTCLGHQREGPVLPTESTATGMSMHPVHRLTAHTRPDSTTGSDCGSGQ